MCTRTDRQCGAKMFPSKDSRNGRCGKTSKSTPELNIPCDYSILGNRLLTEEQNMATISEVTDSGKSSRLQLIVALYLQHPNHFLELELGSEKQESNSILYNSHPVQSNCRSNLSPYNGHNGSITSPLSDGSDGAAAISDQLVRILQYHFPSADPEDIIRSVKKARAQFNIDMMSCSLVSSPSTTPEDGPLSSLDRPLPDSTKSSFTFVDEQRPPKT